MIRRLHRGWVFGALAFALGGTAFCLVRPSLPPAGIKAAPPYLTIFLIDGLSQTRFEALLENQRLPELGRLAREGTRIVNGISAFPSMTGYGFFPFLTGRDATGSGILGLRWFDRQRLRGNIRNYVGRSNVHMNTDLLAEPQTLFERVSPQHTFAINALVDRGVRHKVMSGWDFTMAKYSDHWWVPRLLRRIPFVGSRLAPDMAEAERRVLNRAIADLENVPKVQWVTFTSPDAYAHINGIDARYDDLVMHVDALIGAYRGAAAARGLEKDRIYAVLTDHGLIDVRSNVDLRVPLERVGLRVHREEATRVWDAGLDEELAERLSHAEAVLLVNGNSLNYLYVRGEREAFGERVPRETLKDYAASRGRADLVAAVANTDGVDFVITRARDGNVWIDGRGGSGIIRTQTGRLAYEAHGTDPLGYAHYTPTRGLMDGAFHPPDAWLQASVESEFPDALWRLTRLLEQSDCGDMVVLGREGFDLAADYERFVSNYRGGHGGLRADELRVPYLLAGPGVAAAATVRVARAEDVGATLLRLLKLPPNNDAEGQAIAAPVNEGR